MALMIPCLVVAGVVLLYALYVERKTRGTDRIPPGAKRLPGPACFPLIGRVHDVPAEASWLKFYEWSKVYGPIYQMEIFGSVHVWISSEQVAHDLLARRALKYSDRPQIPNLPDNRTKGDYLALTGRNETWKRQRKLCQQLMTVSANASLHDYPRKERDRFLYLLSRDPSQYREYIEQFTSRTVSRLSWGSPHPAQLLRVTTAGLLETISPSGALPNVISWLMYLPRWLSPWQQREASRHALEATLLKGNVQFVRDRLREGAAEPSFVRTFLDSVRGKEGRGDEADEATYVVGQMAIAGALTIGSPIQSFLLAMLHYPGWQTRLQEEIDRVCEGRCPEWRDQERMPLLRAVVKEVIRWRPPVPTGIPHAIEKDDVYNGYFIPAGATIHALEWGITRDESTYPDPEAFNPARWLEPAYPTYREPLSQHPNLQGFSQFGFGRRTCQGVPIVEQDLFLAMGGTAWALTLRPRPGVPVHWDAYTPLLIAKPAPFAFDAVVRSEEKRGLLRQMWEAGKGEDDDDDPEDEEEEGVRVRRRAEDDDGGDTDDSDRGSETSGLTGSVSSMRSGSESLEADGVDVWG
ncbi:cytochrome P450 [Xylariomycetidae sp. FL0641]|nr:cytochrome P450 [Xylariomycetidae sp. FL0641]